MNIQKIVTDIFEDICCIIAVIVLLLIISLVLAILGAAGIIFMAVYWFAYYALGNL